MRTRLPLGWLLAIPFLVYLLSYIHLALYHGKAWLFGTVVHEGGTFTLLQTIFYASHFLGHIPSLTVIALLFTGFCAYFFRLQGEQYSVRTLWLLLIGFIGACFMISFAFFGTEDTVDFLLQQKQGINNPVQGGSWNLHLPSTMTLFLFVPVFLFVISLIFRRPSGTVRSGLPLIAAAAALIPALTLLFNNGSIAPLWDVWTDARYLAHSVRELATFPLVYFPIPLYFFLRFNDNYDITHFPTRRMLWISAADLALTLVLLYQILVPMRAGIGQLAYKPTFAEGGELSILYLLTSHYFEHVLDTIYFTLVCLLLASIKFRKGSLS